jgi:small subunit ribosomal protein S21
LSITVDVRNGNLEKALRIMKRKVMKEGLIKTLRDKQYYSKPSEKRREKNKAKKKMLYQLSKKNDEMLGIVLVKGRKVKRV